MSKNCRYFQWVLGDKKDQICLFDHIENEDGINYIVFTDKTRINENLVVQLNAKDLTGKLMAEIDHPDNKWTSKEEWVGRQEEVWQWRDETNPVEKVCVQPFVEGKKVIKLVPPRPTPPTHSVFGLIRNANNPVPIVTPTLINSPDKTSQSSSINVNDPIYILINKSKKQEVEINMNISISLPSINLYNIAKENFQEGSTTFIEYISQEISVDEIKKALKIALLNMYENSDDSSNLEK